MNLFLFPVGGTGGGGEPPTRPPGTYVTKPTPLGPPSFTERPESESDSNSEGTSGNSGNDNPMDTSVVDSAWVCRGPRVHSSSSDLYPVNCPPNLMNNIPIHPATHFIRREICTEEGLATAQQSLAENQFEILEVSNELEILRNYMQVQQHAQANVFAEVCRAITRNPTSPFLTEANIDRTKAVCVENLERTASFVRHLQQRLASLIQAVNLNLAEVSAIRFGMNYARHHPMNEFVIYLMEEGHVLQRTNSFHPSRFTPTEELEEPVARVTLAPPPQQGPIRKKTPTRRPRDKRSNVLTNYLMSEANEIQFDVVNIDHAFQMVNLLNIRKNVLIAFPDKIQIYRSLTQSMDHNLIAFYDSVKSYFTSGRYETYLKKMTSDYFKFTEALENSSIDFDSKKHFIWELNENIRYYLGDQIKWFYDTYNSIQDVTKKIADMSHKMYSIKI